MNTDANYVVIDRKVLEGQLGQDWNNEEVDAWIEENELPLVTIPEFQKSMVENTMRWFPNDGKIDLHVLIYGIAGEAGECADTMKKFLRGSLTEQQFLEKIAEESVDLFHYICLAWYVLKIDPGEVYLKKTIENEKRFGPNKCD